MTHQDGKATPENAAIGRRIVEAREVRGLRQIDLANLLGRSVGTISNWERGIVTIRAADLRDLSTELKIPYDWLLYGEEGMSFELPNEALSSDYYSEKFGTRTRLEAPRGEIKSPPEPSAPRLKPEEGFMLITKDTAGRILNDASEFEISRLDFQEVEGLKVRGRPFALVLAVIELDDERKEGSTVPRRREEAS